MLPPSACPIPENEPQRLRAVRAYKVLDTEPELEFDALTRVAAHAFAMPIALVAIMDSDRLWFKSKLGLDVPQLDRKIAFCAHAIMQPTDALVIEDLRADHRFVDNPLVTGEPHIRFYAGAPIVDSGHHALGTIAVIDAQPRIFNAAQRSALMDLSTLVMTALQARRRALDLEHLAMTDHLTGIASRAKCEIAIESELRQGSQSEQQLAVLLMDLNGFKYVNDTFGHAAGDAVLCEVARRLSGLVRHGDTLARLGGDEFALVVRDGDARTVAALAARISNLVRRPIVLSDGSTVRVGISVGSASCTSAISSAEALLGQADEALYRAKQGTAR
jgi:diguanylate cyclase (GGDEF)-like protein